MPQQNSWNFMPIHLFVDSWRPQLTILSPLKFSYNMARVTGIIISLIQVLYRIHLYLYKIGAYHLLGSAVVEQSQSFTRMHMRIYTALLVG